MLWIINRTVSKDGRITEIMHVKCLACCLSQGNYCYELNIFVFPKFICWGPNPQFDGVKRWDLWEVVRFRLDHELDLYDRISALKRRERDFSLKERHGGKAVWRHKLESGSLQSRNWVLTRHWICLDFDLRLLASRTMRNKFLFINPPSLYLVPLRD